MSETEPEVKAILRAFIAKQREKYGEDWKRILADQMAAKTTPVLTALLALRKK